MSLYRAFAPAGPMPSPPPGREWTELMAQAIAQARVALAQGDVPVGAIVVDGHGRALARAGNRVERDSDATAHAEILAIREAGQALGTCRLAGCVLVATLEPCLMCAAACLQARLAGVVYGAADPAAGAIVSNADCFDRPPGRVWHMGGILAGECADLLNDFFRHRRALPWKRAQ